MLNDEITRKYKLIDNDNYKKLRNEYLRFIVEKANSPISSDVLRGMLLLVNESDRWEREYLAECKKLKNKE